jgi:hypothetical protein
LRRPLISAAVGLWYLIAALWWRQRLPDGGYEYWASLFALITLVYVVRVEVLRRKGRLRP